ncbi:CLUMA_CG004851, isoform A [Clunio marinus]|uniref:CLUMA_CG004851, isoform A n=1 Tax=Clunio marinus TaxID=568069 RepID=A0A1J1HXB4_9DIPT|nr:CLUMA_CG004851, isoform A [Clunio marinus]
MRALLKKEDCWNSIKSEKEAGEMNAAILALDQKTDRAHEEGGLQWHSSALKKHFDRALKDVPYEDDKNDSTQKKKTEFGNKDAVFKHCVNMAMSGKPFALFDDPNIFGLKTILSVSDLVRNEFVVCAMVCILFRNSFAG